MKDPQEFNACAQRLKALADPDRLRIVSELFHGPSNVSDLAAQLGAEVVNVSHHLGVLKHAGLVESQKQGRFVIYQLHPDIRTKADLRARLQTIDLGCCRLDLES